MGFKLMFKNIIRRKLERYVKKYFRKHPEVKLVIVTGSVGKTSTKIAIATVLSEHFRVRLHEGNYNAELSAPTSILGINYPEEIKNPLAWIEVFRAAKLRISEPTDVDIIVQEVGSDRIGQVPHFGKYAKPDICVVSAVSPEHMEYFGTIENVAKEELAAVNFSKIAIINRDDIDGEYAKYINNPNIDTYGTSGNAEYKLLTQKFSVEEGYSGEYFAPELKEPINVKVKVLGDHSLRPIIAAGAVALKLGLSPEHIISGFAKFHAVPGRMNVLKGFEDTILIDDTYNSSPLAAECAIRALYELSAPQRIAVLGDMNELGDMSASEHEKLGKLCKPDQLEWVITVGEQAEKYLAPAAKSNGCQVKSFNNAQSAGAFVRSVMRPQAVILFKGSQGNIYLEEAVKMTLLEDFEEDKLVRQSPDWMEKKLAFFEKINTK